LLVLIIFIGNRSISATLTLLKLQLILLTVIQYCNDLAGFSRGKPALPYPLPLVAHLINPPGIVGGTPNQYERYNR
jgi:hypothetical protein